MSALAVLENALGDGLSVQVSHKAIGVQSNLLRVVDEDWCDVFRFAPGRLVLVELVVHLPEFALQARGFSGLRGNQGVFVWRNQWPLTKYNPQPIAIFAFDLLELRIIRPTSAALKVGKLFQGHRRVGITADVWRFCAGRVG